jgi:outer membrane lipoprotein SlyB
LQNDGVVASHSMKRAGFAVALMLMSAAAATAPAFARPKNSYDAQSAYVDQRYGGSARDPWVGATRDVYVNNQDTNSCLEGSVIGGLLGAGLGAALSRGDGRWVGVPVGGAAGALLGCQVDGG